MDDLHLVRASNAELNAESELLRQQLARLEQEEAALKKASMRDSAAPSTVSCDYQGSFSTLAWVSTLGLGVVMAEALLASKPVSTSERDFLCGLDESTIAKLLLQQQPVLAACVYRGICDLKPSRDATRAQINDRLGKISSRLGTRRDLWRKLRRRVVVTAAFKSAVQARRRRLEEEEEARRKRRPFYGRLNAAPSPPPAAAAAPTKPPLPPSAKQPPPRAPRLIASHCAYTHPGGSKELSAKNQARTRTSI